MSRDDWSGRERAVGARLALALAHEGIDVTTVQAAVRNNEVR